jgi:Phosphopantetheine attachment site
MAVDETKREVEVLAIFRQLLGAPQLGPEQNFFESGGSSLLAARLAARLRASGVLDVPTSAIFAAPTARELTRYAPAPASHAPDHDGAAGASLPSGVAERGARQRAAFARLRPTSSPAEGAQ